KIYAKSDDIANSINSGIDVHNISLPKSTPHSLTYQERKSTASGTCDSRNYGQYKDITFQHGSTCYSYKVDDKLKPYKDIINTLRTQLRDKAQLNAEYDTARKAKYEATKQHNQAIHLANERYGKEQDN
ncbi:hypothetical protein, partial [Vibrio anguillarum]